MIKPHIIDKIKNKKENKCSHHNTMNLATPPTKGHEQLYPTPNTYKTNHPYEKPPS